MRKHKKSNKKTSSKHELNIKLIIGVINLIIVILKLVHELLELGLL